MILTDEKGRPIPKPNRKDFPPGVEGTVAHMRAMYAWKDKISSVANKAFVEGLRNRRQESDA